MKHAILISSLAVSVLATAGTSPNVLFRRQTSNDCPQGYTLCGDGCIVSGYTCCPDGSGGCEPTDYCQLGSNNQYLCCPEGEVCTGDGGVDTSYIYDSSSFTTTRTTSRATSVASSTATITGTPDTCESGWKSCGIYCIPALWECCPDLGGGCDPDVARCWQGSNGVYGCCANTVTAGCTGTAGAASTLASTFSDAVGTSTRSSTRTSSTSTRTSSRTSSTASSTSTASAAGGSQTFSDPATSLLSLVMAVVALVY